MYMYLLGAQSIFGFVMYSIKHGESRSSIDTTVAYLLPRVKWNKGMKYTVTHHL